MLNDCTFSPDGSFYVSAGQDGLLKIWDTETGRVRATLDVPHESLQSCAVSPDGALVVAVAHGGSVTLWDSATGTEQEVMQHTEQLVGGTGCAFSPDGARIVSAAKDGTIKIWETATGEEQTALKHHTDFLQAVAVSPDGSFLVAASHEGMRMVFQDNLPGADFGTPSNALSMWDLETGRERPALEGSAPTVGVCAISPDASFIVSAHWGGAINVWDAKTGKLRHSFGDGSLCADCAVSPDGASVITASSGGTLKLWDARTGAERTSTVLSDDLTCVALHPHKPLAICGDIGGELHAVDLVGVSYGPIIVTPLDMGEGPVVRCPECSKLLPLQEEWLGKTITCPERGCNGKLRVNPFTVGPPVRVRKLRTEPRKAPRATPRPTPGVARPVREAATVEELDPELVRAFDKTVRELVIIFTAVIGLISLGLAIPVAIRAYRQTASYPLAIFLGVMIPFAIGRGLADILLFYRKLRRLIHGLLWPALTAGLVVGVYQLSENWLLTAVVGFVGGLLLRAVTRWLLFLGIDEKKERAERFKAQQAQRGGGR
jgi:hypothetical protein